VTLLELLIAMGVALVVVLCATAAFIGGKQLFTADAEAQAGFAAAFRRSGGPECRGRPQRTRDRRQPRPWHA
jgi:hypothetical protein